MTTPWYAIVALCISALAFYVAAMNYRRKAGVLIRGTHTLASSRDCNDKYVSSIILENLKDRAITIFTIYLRIGYSYYIEIETFKDKPLILKAFETYHKEYGPIQFYGINSNRMNLDALLDDAKIKKRIVLSTSDGKYIVPHNIPRWNPVGDFFRNHLTAVIRPVCTIYKEKYIGANIKYVVEFIGNSDKVEIVPIHPKDFQLKTFRNFSLTQESLASQVSLTAYLNEQVTSGKLICERFQVYDADSWRVQAVEFYKGRTIEALYFGLLRYHIVGRLFTWYSNWKLRRENTKRRNANTGT
jgi:hypothetical protein